VFIGAVYPRTYVLVKVEKWHGMGRVYESADPVEELSVNVISIMFLLSCLEAL
jgi:hypothetical protein